MNRLLTAFTFTFTFMGVIPCQAELILQNTTNSLGSAAIFAGESFTTPNAGTITNILFNFYTDNKTTAEAPGTAYLLSAEYLGTPNGLSSSTTGFLGSAVGASNEYTFNTSIALQANTQYWVYTTAFAFYGYGSSADGGYLYRSGNGTAVFSAATGDGAFFNLDGTVSPEPASLGLVFAGLSSLAIVARRRRPARKS